MTGPLLLDEHYAPKISAALRERGVDATSVAGNPQLEGTSDETLLDWATREGSCIVTENVRDFMPLFHRAMERGSIPAGLVFTSPRRFPRSAEGTGKLIDALAELAGHKGIPRPGEVCWL